MKLATNYTLFAESVIRDETKKISIINIFDKINAAKLPAIQAKIIVIFAVKLKAGGDEKELSVSVFTPDGNQLVRSPLPAKLDPAESKDGQIVADFSSMPITQYGDYKFELSYGDEAISTRMLPVEPVESEQN